MAALNLNSSFIKRTSARLKYLCGPGCAICVALALFGWPGRLKPARIWQPSEVPIAYWAWRSEAPTVSDLERARIGTDARALFLRAGQIDYQEGELRRIRSVIGTLPRDFETHLVYNATRSCMTAFEKLDPADFASAVSTSYAEDARRAERDGAIVAGVQMDIDVPTRLLANYERTLRALRERLPQRLRLSITGLPTWMNSPALERTLASVDFWIPQFYGAAIPERLNRRVPISSPELVARAVQRARGLNRPFYAGLPAYGYAIHYGRDGSLLNLRGDLDPSLVVANSNFEMVERCAFNEASRMDGEPLPAFASERRYVYRARRDSLIDEIYVKSGEWIMLDMPCAASLRESARMVRERAGDLLLGICVFRLPTRADHTTLTIREIASALADIDPHVSFDLEIKTDVPAGERGRRRNQVLQGNQVLLLAISNNGSAGSLMGDKAMTLILHVPPGSVRAISLQGFDSSDSLCRIQGEENAPSRDQPCGKPRANLLSLMTTAWPTEARAVARIEFAHKPPPTIKAEFSMTLDDAREVRVTKIVEVSDRGEQ
jgi:hypothetical protein